VVEEREKRKRQGASLMATPKKKLTRCAAEKEIGDPAGGGFRQEKSTKRKGPLGGGKTIQLLKKRLRRGGAKK